MAEPTDTLADTLDDVSKRRAQLESEATHLENQLMALRGVLREAVNQESVLRTLIKSRTPSPLPLFDGEQALSQPPADDWGNLSRSWVVREAVAEITRTKAFASPGNIEEFLTTRNRHDDRDAIGAALSYLRKKGEVVQLGRAQWGVPVEEVNP